MTLKKKKNYIYLSPLENLIFVHSPPSQAGHSCTEPFLQLLSEGWVRKALRGGSSRCLCLLGMLTPPLSSPCPVRVLLRCHLVQPEAGHCHVSAAPEAYLIVVVQPLSHV